MLKKITAFILIVLLASCTQDPQPYDEAANAANEIKNALATAKNNGKFVLLEFGANWCTDCVVLDDQMHTAPLKGLIDKNFIVVKVDIGEGDRNKDVIERYGYPVERGIPSVVVLDKNDSILMSTLNGQLARARSMGKVELYKFFESVIEKSKNQLAES